jgi:hypothetical protein
MKLMGAAVVRVTSFKTTEDLLESGHILVAGRNRGIVHARIFTEKLFCEFVQKVFDMILTENDRSVSESGGEVREGEGGD